MRKFRLGDIANVDISGIDKKTKDGEQAVRLCNFTDVYYNWAITKNMYGGLMRASASESDIETFSLRKGQVAITKDSETRDDIGVATYIADDFEDVVLGYHCALISPKDDIPEDERIYGKYLNALLHTKYAQKYFSNNATGSGQRYTLSKEAIEDMPVYLPSYKEQVHIGDYLSNIDKKIETNNHINAELEAMTKQVYDYWFMQYDFPDENGNPYRSSGGKMVWNETLKREIPEDWEHCLVIDYIQPIERGISYTSESIENPEGEPMLNLACFTKKGDYRRGELKFYSGIIDDNSIIFPGDMLIACTDMTRDAGIIGSPIIVNKEYEKYVYTTDLAKLTPKECNSKFYLNYVLKDSSFHKYIKPFASGTNVLHLNLKGVEEFVMVKAPTSIVQKFDEICKNNKDLQDILTNDIVSLEKQREIILPLLLNGQYTIKD